MHKKDLLIIPAIALVLGIYYYMFIKLKPYISSQTTGSGGFQQMFGRKTQEKGSFGDITNTTNSSSESGQQ